MEFIAGELRAGQGVTVTCIFCLSAYCVPSTNGEPRESILKGIKVNNYNLLLYRKNMLKIGKLTQAKGNINQRKVNSFYIAFKKHRLIVLLLTSFQLVNFLSIAQRFLCRTYPRLVYLISGKLWAVIAEVINAHLLSYDIYCNVYCTVLYCGTKQPADSAACPRRQLLTK